MARQFEVYDAKRERVPLLVGLMGPSGGGKTYSALRLARGIQEVAGGEIYGVDTEARRMLAYADTFAFKHLDFKPPFGSLDYLEAIRFCVSKGAKTIIVDSMTHEHIGQGGYLETAEATVKRIARTDEPSFEQRKKLGMLGWAEAGPKRQKMIEGIKQLNVNLIFCFRSKEKVKPAPKDAKDRDPIALGFMPLAGEDLLFEMSVNMLLLPRADGIPTWRSDAVGERMMMKLPEQFRPIFGEGQTLDETAGRLMAEWASGKDIRGPAAAQIERQPAQRSLKGDLQAAAERGTFALEQFIRGLTDVVKEEVALVRAKYDAIAIAADAADPELAAIGDDTFPGDLPSRSEDLGL